MCNYAIEEAGIHLDGVDCYAVPKNAPLERLNGGHHETHPNPYQELSTCQQILTLYNFLVGIRYGRLLA